MPVYSFRFALFLVIFFCGGMFSCQTQKNSAEFTSIVEITDSCVSNPSHSYEVFIPSIEKSSKNLPLLVVVDPHGNGKLALAQFKDASTKYPAVLVASNLVQNNDPNYMHELEELVADVKGKYQVGSTLYLSGFSGGSRMVLNYATIHNANGVIACGAFAGHDQITALKCPMMAIAGMDDFNFSEVAPFVLNPEKTPNNVIVEITQAAHTWPDKDILISAFGYFRLSEPLIESVLGGNSQIKKYVLEQHARIDSLKQLGEMIQAEMVARNMGLVTAFEKLGSFAALADELLKDKSYQQQQSQLLTSLRFEMKVREAYLKAFDEKDANWWATEITSLSRKIGDEPNAINKAAFQRLKGFLGIVCYSYCGRFAAQNDRSKLEQTLAIYRLVEPDNTDMMNFTKLLEQLEENY